MDPLAPVTPDPLNPQPTSDPLAPAPGMVEPQSDPSPLDAQPPVFDTQPQPLAMPPAPEAPAEPAFAPAPTPVQPDFAAADPGSVPLAAPGTPPAVDPYAQPVTDASQAAPASVAGPVPMAQPASMPAFMNSAPLTGQVNTGGGKKKSKMILVIVLVIILLFGGGGAAYALTRKKADKPAATTTDTTSKSTTDDTKKSDDTDQQSTSKTAKTAKYSTDFEAVCQGSSISNSAAYTSNKTAIIYTFHSSAITTDSWSSDLIGYGKSYYLKDLDKFDTISVVACAKYVDDSANGGIDCKYTSGGETVTVKYQATKYKLTYYEAKTGKKISDGGEIAGTATKCPSSILYDKDKKVAYADPDEDALEAAQDKFVQ